MEFDLRAELPLLLRLLVAGALAAMLGWEREAAHKPAGLRTHMLVGIASALFTILSALAVGDYSGPQAGLRSDPVRVIQAVAIGIGFLGSGVIFVKQRVRAGTHHGGLDMGNRCHRNRGRTRTLRSGGGERRDTTDRLAGDGAVRAR